MVYTKDEKKLLEVIEEEQIARANGGTNEEFDKLIKYLEYCRMPQWKRILASFYIMGDIALGVFFVLFVLLASGMH